MALHRRRPSGLLSGRKTANDEFQFRPARGLPDDCRRKIGSALDRGRLGGTRRNIAFLFSFRPANFHPPALPIEQNVPVGKLDSYPGRAARAEPGAWSTGGSKNGAPRSGKRISGRIRGPTCRHGRVRGSGRQPDCGHAGRGCFLVCGGWQMPADFGGTGIILRLRAFGVHRPAGKSLGGHRWPWVEPD